MNPAPWVPSKGKGNDRGADQRAKPFWLLLIAVSVTVTITLGIFGARALRAQHARASVSTPTPQNTYQQIQRMPPTISDALDGSSANKWETAKNFCSFQSGSFIVSQMFKGYRTQCRLFDHTFSSFAMQANIRVMKGGASGFVFYTAYNDSLNVGYRFTVTSSGVYSLIAASGAHPTTLRSGLAGDFNTGYGQSNTLMITVKGAVFYAYVNGEFLMKDTLGASGSGLIGFYVYDDTQPTEAAFSNLRLWSLA